MKAIGLLLLGLFLHSLSNETRAKQLDDATTSSKQDDKIVTYTIGISDINHYPYFSLTKNEDRGFAWSILESFAKQQGIKFEYKVLPITKLQYELEHAGIDFIFPDNPIWVRFKDSANPNIYSASIVQAVAVSYTTKYKEDYTIEQIKKVAIPFGYTSSQWFDAIKKYNIETLPVSDLLQGLYSLRISNTDATDIEYNIANYLTKQNPYWNQVTIARNLPSAPVNYHLSSIKHIQVLEEISDFISNNKDLILHYKNQYNIKYYDEVFTNY